MVGKLTTHVLDTAQGCPARQMTIELWSIDSNKNKTLLKLFILIMMVVQTHHY
ncbi:MAG: hypothetical protein N4J56_006272 [Chroococcidiopsis sp. SAG 2025]|nr:hypothetical protein [Chroococcidiopsis sp. SAG 2025]